MQYFKAWSNWAAVKYKPSIAQGHINSTSWHIHCEGTNLTLMFKEKLALVIGTWVIGGIKKSSKKETPSDTDRSAPWPKLTHGMTLVHVSIFFFGLFRCPSGPSIKAGKTVWGLELFDSMDIPWSNFAQSKKERFSYTILVLWSVICPWPIISATPTQAHKNTFMLRLRKNSKALDFGALCVRLDCLEKRLWNTLATLNMLNS